MVRFVIPAFNEAENIGRLLEDLGPRAHKLGARVIFVDDGSTDGTADHIDAHRDGLHLSVVRHRQNQRSRDVPQHRPSGGAGGGA